MFGFRPGAGVLFASALYALCPPSAFGAEVTPDEQKLIKRIPAGYRILTEENDSGVSRNFIRRGDLNGDGADDCVLFVEPADGEEYAGVMIFFKDGGDYKLALENLRCFYTEFYWPSQVEIKKGNLYMTENRRGTCSSYIYTYTFKYRNSDFELIGYDAAEDDCGGWDENHARVGGSSSKTSVNFLAKKRLYKEGGKETWSAIAVKGPILLRKIVGLTFEIYTYINSYMNTAANSGAFTDLRDGNAYWTVTIGGDTWMAENLNYKPKAGKSWCYDNSDGKCKEYGRLYDWATARKVCPAGWKLPDTVDWHELESLTGGRETAGKMLKSTNGWNSLDDKDGNGADAYGFSALPGGYRNGDNGFFQNFGYFAYWWASTAAEGINAYNRGVGYDGDQFNTYYGPNTNGLSVRCVKE